MLIVRLCDNKILEKGMNSNLILAALLLVVLVVAGTSGYVFLEGYSFADGLYMTIITITTVGFGEVKPLSSLGRVFTSVLILFGFASLAYVAHAIMDALLNKLLSLKSEKQRMEKQISNLKSHYIICGFGRVGAAALDKFIEAGVGYVIIEANHVNCQALREKKYPCIEGNAVEEETLELAGVKNARGLLAILPSDPDNLFISLTAREMNPTLHIIARAQNAASEKKLLQAGADSVISPYTSAGQQIANDMLIAAGAVSGTKWKEKTNKGDETLSWLQVQKGSSMVGKAIEDVARKMKGRVLGLRRSSRDHLDPDFGWTLEAGDNLLIYEKSVDIITPEQKKQMVVIVDDNSVILRLYTRLLRQGGFMVKTATNGGDALDLIIKEKPNAAVIEFKLPILSGIEICEKVRADRTCDDVKLILFTADEDPETRERALEAGANAFVLKGPEASELIETVIHLLNQNMDKPRVPTETEIALQEKEILKSSKQTESTEVTVKVVSENDIEIKD